MLGDTVVFAETVGVGTAAEVRKWAEMALDAGLKPALHLHHRGDESKALALIRAGLLHGIKEFDSSIGGLGGCPFAIGSGANLSTETLVRHLHAWGFETGIDLEHLKQQASSLNQSGASQMSDVQIQPLLKKDLPVKEKWVDVSRKDKDKHLAVLRPTLPLGATQSAVHRKCLPTPLKRAGA